MPIYWLEPNKCIKVTDADTSIDGFYSINSFSIPFTSNGSMTLSCNKMLQMVASTDNEENNSSEEE